MFIYSLRSQDLNRIAEELISMGIKVEMKTEEEITSPQEVKVEKYLRIEGDNVYGSIYQPQLLSFRWINKFNILDFRKDKKRDAYEFIYPRDKKKLIDYVTHKYRLPVSRDIIVMWALSVAVAAELAYVAYLALT